MLQTRWKNAALATLLASGGTIAAERALGDGWAMRPGLWEITTTTELSPQLRAQMEAHSFPVPAPQVQQTCVKSGSNDASKSLFDPSNEPAGACQEKILSDDENGREIEDDCNLAPMSMPPGAGHTQLPPIPAEARRHVIKSADGAELIDRLEIHGGPVRARLVRSLRWLAAECPADIRQPQ